MKAETTRQTFFERLVTTKRKLVTCWLMSRYPYLSINDAEDIFQDASVALWLDYGRGKISSHDNLLAKVKVYCRNIYTHWLRKASKLIRWPEDYDMKEDAIEDDYGYISNELARKRKMERLYSEIEQLKPSDREFIEMTLRPEPTQGIMTRFTLKNPQVVRNKKCKIVARLRKALL